MKNSLSTLSTIRSTGPTVRNRMRRDPLQSVDDIAGVAENETSENAILIARTEINMLDKLSLDGDIPGDVSESR